MRTVESGAIPGSQEVNPCHPGTMGRRKGGFVCAVGRAARRALHPARHGTAGGSGTAETYAVALGACAHRTRVGVDSYQRPSVAYGSAGKLKWPKSGQVKGPAQTFFMFSLTVSFHAFTQPHFEIPVSVGCPDLVRVVSACYLFLLCSILIIITTRCGSLALVPHSASPKDHPPPSIFTALRGSWPQPRARAKGQGSGF